MAGFAPWLLLCFHELGKVILKVGVPGVISWYILGLYRDSGKENENYRASRVYIGLMYR